MGSHILLILVSGLGINLPSNGKSTRFASVVISGQDIHVDGETVRKEVINNTYIYKKKKNAK